MGGAIELRTRDDVATQFGDIERCVIDRRLPRAHAQGLQSSFQRRDAPLQHGSGRIADAAVAISLGFQIEQRRSMVGAIERIGYRLINRDSHGLRRRIDFVAAVNSDRFPSHVITWRFGPTGRSVCELIHFAHYPLDVRLGGPKTSNARPENRGAAAELDFRHPRDLALMEI